MASCARPARRRVDSSRYSRTWSSTLWKRSQEEELHLVVGEWHVERHRSRLPGWRRQYPDAVVGLRPLDQQIEIKIGKIRSRRPIYKLKPISEPGSSLRANAMYA